MPRQPAEEAPAEPSPSRPAQRYDPEPASRAGRRRAGAAAPSAEPVPPSRCPGTRRGRAGPAHAAHRRHRHRRPRRRRAPLRRRPPRRSDADGDDDDEVAGAYVTPLVRKLASEHGVDLSTAHRHRCRRTDPQVRRPRRRRRRRPRQPRPRTLPSAGPPLPRPAELRSGAPAAAPGRSAIRGRGRRTAARRVEKMSRMRQVIAARMVESLQISAQLTTVVEVDVTKIARLRDQAKARLRGARGRQALLPAVLRRWPRSRRSRRTRSSTPRSTSKQKTITYHDAEHLGIAVDTERGLLVPVIHDAGDLNLGGIARKIADLAERTRSNKVSPDELGGGTFTLTNTGSRGALFDTPIINQPQVGILGTGHRRQAPGRRQRRRTSARRSRSARWSTWRCPTTTASSTAPTPPASSSPSRSGSRPATSNARSG